MNSEHWVLEGTILRPTWKKLELLMSFMQENISNDEKIKVRLSTKPSNAVFKAPILIHRSVLCAASAPLEKMVTGPFAENKSKVIDLYDEDAKYADVLVKHMYGKPVDLASYDCGLAKCADKWELRDLFEAFFLAFDVRPMDAVDKFMYCFPIMATLKIPSKLKYLLSKAFGQNISRLGSKLGRQLIDPAKSIEESLLTVFKAADDPRSKIIEGIFPDSALAEWYLWDMFLFQNMLVDVFKHISMYGEIEARELLISVLVHIENDLSDSQLETCLCYAGCHVLVETLTPEGLMAEKHQKLTCAALKLLCNPLEMTYPALHVTWKLSLRALKRDGELSFSQTRHRGNKKFIFKVDVNWPCNDGGRDRMFARVQISGDMNMTLSKQPKSLACLKRGGTLPYLGVRASCNACTCVDHSNERDYIGVSEGIQNYSDGDYNSSLSIFLFQIMSISEVSAFLDIHDDTTSCGLVFHIAFYPDLLDPKIWNN